VLEPETAAAVNDVFAQMEKGLHEKLGAQADSASFERTFDGRLVGQTWDTPFIEVPGGTIDDAAVATMIANFHETYEGRAGNRFEALPVQGVTYRAQATVPIDKVAYAPIAEGDGSAPEPERELTLRWIYGEEVTAKEYEREKLRSGDRIEGPAVIRERLSTTQVCPGQTASIGRFGEIVIERSE
jgi:N-methylhydantoinase A